MSIENKLFAALEGAPQDAKMADALKLAYVIGYNIGVTAALNDRRPSANKYRNDAAEFDRLMKRFTLSPNARTKSRSGIKTMKPKSGVSDEARELVLYIENDGNLYRSQTQPIIKNLKLKQKKGKYNHNLAKKLWGYLADSGAKKYYKEHGSPSDKWFDMFPVSVRKEVATILADNYLEEIKG